MLRLIGCIACFLFLDIGDMGYSSAPKFFPQGNFYNFPLVFCSVFFLSQSYIVSFKIVIAFE